MPSRPQSDGKRSPSSVNAVSDREDNIENIEMSNKKDKYVHKGPTRYGPMEKRSCTDIICCLLFLVFIIGSAVVSYFAFTQGDYRILLYPTNSNGEICGYGNYSDQQNLLFFDLMECAKAGPIVVAQYGCPTPQVCVSTCPSTNWVWLTLLAQETTQGVDIKRREEQLRCVDLSYRDPNVRLTDLITQKKCAPYLLESVPLAGRCIPSIFKHGINLLSNILDNQNQTMRDSDNKTITYNDMKNASTVISYFFNALGIAQNVFRDVETSWYLILSGIGLGAVVSFIWCVLVRCVTGCIVFGTLGIFFVAFAGSTGYCAFKYLESNQTIASLNNQFFTQDYRTYAALQETWLALGILSAICFLIVFIVLICLRKRICLAVHIIRQASKAVSSILFSLIFPIWPFLLQVVVIGYILTNMVFLAATGRQITTSVTNESQLVCSDSISNELACQFMKYGGNEWSFYLQAYNIFMGFWLTCFVVGLNQMILAGAFASWYWAFTKPKDIPTFPLLSSVWRSLRYHLGTVAFGSLLIAIVKFIRAILSYIQHKLKDHENCCVKFMLCCLKCCFWCLEKFLKFITKNAFIMTALSGKNFCISAKDAFSLILRNCLRVAVVDNVTGFVFFVGRLLVTGLVTLGAFFFFNGDIEFLNEFNRNRHLNYFFVPVIIIALGTLIVATIFFSVFDFAVDTIFLCVMEDLDKNDGSKEKPYFMSKGLMKVLDVDNKLRDTEPDQDGACCCC